MSNEPDPYFKGWAKPGPIPPGATHPGLAEVSDGETLDAISGHYRIFQLKRGHRFSTDDLLTAWYGTSWCPSAQKVLDLGSGIGSVGMVAAWRLQGAHFTTVEAQDLSVKLAQKSAAYNGLTERYEIREGDFRDESVLRSDEKFDLVLGSPPYFAMEAGIHGDHPQKIACRFEMRGTIADYCLVAAKHLNRGGVFACIFPVTPTEQASRVAAGAQAAGLSVIRQRAIILKEGDAPLLGLFAMAKSDDLPTEFREKTWIEPPLTIRMKNGQIHPEYSAVKLSIGFPP